MKVKLLVYFLICYSQISFAQTKEEFFSKSEREVVWLGIDFSHVQLIGEFSQFYSAGSQSPSQLTSTYFPGWNVLVLNEPQKYDIRGMIRRYRLTTDIETITEINQRTDVSKLQVGYSKRYDADFIESVISKYRFRRRNAFGVMFLAESMNKPGQEAFFHIVVLNLKNGEYLFSSRIRGEPRGFGLRNYWGGAIFEVIEDIRDIKYNGWQSTYGNPNYVYDPSKEEDFKEEEEGNLLGGQGTCFAISNNGLFATNYHVVKNGKTIQIILNGDTLLADVLLKDEENDLAILKSNRTPKHLSEGIPYSYKKNEKIGAKIFSIGYPEADVLGINYKYTEGSISSISGVADDKRFYQVSVPLQRGNSGGPLFNQFGQLIGISSRKFFSDKIENISYGLKVDYLENLLNMLPNKRDLITSTDTLSSPLENMIEIYQSYVGIVISYVK